jgi:hypothetical protein
MELTQANKVRKFAWLGAASIAFCYAGYLAVVLTCGLIGRRLWASHRLPVQTSVGCAEPGDHAEGSHVHV